MEQSERGKTPPHAPDAERSVLGGMLIDSNALEIALEQLRPEDFYVPAHETAFSAMLNLRNNGSSVDLVTLTNELEKHGLLERTGGASYLSELMSFVPTTANTQHYIEIVEGKSVQRQLIRAGGEIIRDGMNEEKPLEDALNDAERRIYDISMRKTEDSLVPVEQIVPAAFNRIGELMNRKGKITGVASGFIELDRLTNGFQKSDLVVIAGRPAMGKTSFALNIVNHVASVKNKKVGIQIYNLENVLSE